MVRNHLSAGREDLNESGGFPVHLGYTVCTVRGCLWGKARLFRPSDVLLLVAERLTRAFGLIGLMAWGWFHSGRQCRHGRTWSGSQRVGADAPQNGSPIDARRTSRSGPPPASARGVRRSAEPGLRHLRCSESRRSGSKCRCCPAPTTARSTVALVTSTTRRNRELTGTRASQGTGTASFEGLKDIGLDDLIELDTHQRTDVYRVERTWIVNPEDVSVLDPTPVRALTLVTCYPFYYVGSAPQRFIVRAVLVAASR